MARSGRDVQEDARFRILRLLEDNPEMNQRELARNVGVSIGAVNYVLGALVEKGQSYDGCQFPGGFPQTLIDRGRLAPQGASVRSDSHSDRPLCLSLDLSAAREHLAVRRCIAHCL